MKHYNDPGFPGMFRSMRDAAILVLSIIGLLFMGFALANACSGWAS